MIDREVQPPFIFVLHLEPAIGAGPSALLKYGDPVVAAARAGAPRWDAEKLSSALDDFEFGVSDLLAVTLMDVRIPAGAVRAILRDQRWQEVAAELLSAIPTDVDIRDRDADLSRGSPAWKLYEHLVGINGIGITKATKLLARKRPTLIPIDDDVVRTVLGRPQDTWAEIQRNMRDDRISEGLSVLRTEAGLEQSFPLLHLLDAVMWIAGSGSVAAVRARGELG